MINIAFSGEMGSGKTAFLEYFLKNYGGTHVGFAQPLKQDVIDLNLTIDGKIEKPRDRKILQQYGQFRRNEIQSCHINHHYLENRAELDDISVAFLNNKIIGKSYPEYWVDQTINKIKYLQSQNINTVLDDLRFPNEAYKLIANNVIIFRIFASLETRMKRLNHRDGSFDPNTLNDISETQVKFLPCNYVIENNYNFQSAIDIFENILSDIELKNSHQN